MKAKQQEITSKMQKHVKADEAFYITANTVLNLASRARQLFESSEVDEKRQLLNFVFQNLVLEGEKLAHTLREPFSLIMNKEGMSKWMGVVGLEPTETEVEGFTVPCNCRYAIPPKKNLSTSTFVNQK